MPDFDDLGAASHKQNLADAAITVAGACHGFLHGRHGRAEEVKV